MVKDSCLVGPSLPPFVEGQLRCFLHCSIGDIKWMEEKLLKNVQIAVKWWGQQCKDILLEPKSSCKSKADKFKNEVKYPIRSGPKQFTAYLQDMGVLTLDVLSNGQSIGEIQIKDIGRLCHSQPVQGFYPIVGTAAAGTGKEIGALFVSLAFHSVSGSFNMTSSTIPTTDMSTPQLNKKEQLYGKVKATGREKKKSSKATSSKDKDGKRKEVKISSLPPKRVEYSEMSSLDEEPRFVVGPGRPKTFEKPKENTTDLHSSHHSFNDEVGPSRHDLIHKDKSPGRHHNPQLMGDGERELLATLIERGKDLRNRMLVSTIETLNAVEDEEKKPRDKFEGNLLQDILEQVDEGDTLDEIPTTESPTGHMTYPMEGKLVDLVTGDEHHDISRILKKFDQNSDASISDEFSDVEDPIHEESLINDLFFTKKMSDSDESSIMLTDESADEEKENDKSRRSSLEDPGNKRPKRYSANKNEGKPKSRQNQRRAKEMRENDASSIAGNDSMGYMDLNASQSGPHHRSSQDNGALGKTAGGVSTLESIVPEGMDLDTITALARVQFARVIIHQLELKKDSFANYGHSTFFVEYEFPVSSKDAAGAIQSGAEVIRCASNKVHDDSIIFNHRSVFPVHFDGLSLERCWEKRIVFKVFARSPGVQTPSLLGKQKMNLQHLFLADHFALRERIRIKGTSIYDVNEDGEKPEGLDEIGDLLVSMEFESDKADVKTKTTRAKSAAASRPPLKHANIEMQPVKDSAIAQNNPPAHLIAKSKVEAMQIPTDRPPNQATRNTAGSEVLLHSLLNIPEGRRICKDSHQGLEKPSNCYMICRMFWDEEASRSKVCWSSLDPQFDFMQTIPVMLKESLLERTRNNFMVIEIWNKSLSAENDELIGIVKISLHPFYLSFKDQGIVKTLLKSQYPVIAVDGQVAIQDLFSGSNCGQLQVLLALGTPEQISNLLKMKDKTFGKEPELPLKNRDPRRIVESKHSQIHSDPVEHVFGISVDSANKLLTTDMTDTNEKDCFIQYQFPEQKQKETDFPLVWYKSPTTLFVENPLFGYSHKHTFKSSRGKSIQNFLWNAFNSTSSVKSSGMQFELWQRSYYPNIRDCLLYKTIIPLAKLQAMMTMAKYKDSSLQSFKLPLAPVNIPSDENIDNDDAVLNVTINYQQRQPSPQNIGSVQSKSPCVCLSVSILRACGLKACLHNQRSKKHQLANIALSGFNTFIQVSLSFLETDSVRTSQLIARSFAPTFSYHIDFPVSIVEEFLESDEGDETSTLAYQLESGYIQVQIFHKQTKSGFIPGRRNDFDDENAELLLGVCKIPLIGLLACHTGIKGWYPVRSSWRPTQPRRATRSYCDADEMDCNGGGVEVAVKFGNATDRELVINTARGMGWSPLESVDTHEDSIVDSDLHENVCLNAVINIDKFWFSREILENFSDGDLGDLREFKIYCRYKFYDHGALTTKLTAIERSSSSDLLSADLKHKKNLMLSKTSALTWYLREETFEVQFWLKMLKSNEPSVTQKMRDKMIGSAFLDASRIAKNPSMKGSVSGLYPIYKFGADYLGKSCVRMSLSITYNNATDANSSSMEDETFSSSYPIEKDSEIHGQGMETIPNEAGRRQRKSREERTQRLKNVDEVDVSSQEEMQDPVTGIDCRIVVEEALHLPLVDDSQGERCPPTTYVSYQLTPFHNPTYTSIVLHSTKPRWNLEITERIDPSKVISQAINFKLYRKSDSSDTHPDASKDVLIGTAVVDLSLLKSGFRQIYGWYNITDFTGHCVGQIKVGVIPEEPVSTSPSARYFRKEVLTEKIYSVYPNFVPRMAPLLLDNGNEGESIPTADGSRQMPQFQREDAQETKSVSHSFSDSSKSMLFHKLRDQMDDLDSLNKILRDKLKSEDSTLHPHTITNHAGIQSERLISGLDNALEKGTIYSESTKQEKPVRDTGVPSGRIVDYDAFLAAEGENIHVKPEVLKTSYQDECVEVNGDPTDSSFQHEGTSDRMKPSHDFNDSDLEVRSTDERRDGMFIPREQCFSVTDRICVNPGLQENDDNAFDSFDDVLNDWKKYRVQTDKDDLVIETNSDQSASDGCMGGDESASERENDTRNIDAVSRNCLTLNQVHGNTLENSALDKILKDDSHFETETEFNKEIDNSINGIETDIIREITRNILQPSELILRDKMNDGENRDTDNEQSNQNDLGDATHDDHCIAHEDEDIKDSTIEESSTSRNQEKSSDNTSRIPNFFMPPERLAQSMQKLRLSASHRQTQEYIESSDEETGLKSHRKDSKDLERRYERRKKFYGTKNTKLPLDKPPPLQSTEMNRIASIFSSKFP